MTNDQAYQRQEWELLDYIDNLESEWQRSLPRYNDKELLEVFPEAKIIVRRKIKELEQVQSVLVETIKEKLAIIKKQVSDEFSQWFWREWVKVTDGKNLFEIEERLKNLKWAITPRQSNNRITDQQIKQALAVPIERLIGQPFRKSGKTMIMLCPLHKEKNASFYIYPQTNTCWCYGCNQGGNAINLARMLYNFSFIEAVNYLASK